MNGQKAARETFRPHPFLHTAIWIGGLMFLLLQYAPPIQAADSQIPWECSNYEGDARTRCLNAFIESQREKITQLEGELQAQQNTVNQLKNQIESQAEATAKLQRQLSDRPAISFVRPIYPYTPYTYFFPPTLGFGLHFGNPYLYGSPRYYGLHWGHRHLRP